MNLTSTLLVLDRKETSIDLQALEDCREINDYLQHILLDDGTQLRSIFSALQPIIQKQSTLRGPKNFRKLLDSIFDFMKKYSQSRIENYEEHSVILSLTYYLKIFKQFLTTNQKIQTDIIFAVSNIHLYLRNDEIKRLNSAEDKVLDIGQILAAVSKSNQERNYQYYKNVYTLLTALIAYFRGMFKKAQTIFGSFFTKLTSQHKEVISSQHNMEIMSVTAYYSHLNLFKLGQHELSCYYLTKALEFATKTGPKAESFINKIKEVGSEKAIRVVKLTRIQNKLQVLNRTRSSWHSRQMKTKIYNKKQTIDQKVVCEQLQSIFTIKDKKVTMYRLRKQNMKYLVKQQNKLTLNIQKKQEQLVNICKMRQKLQAATQINNVQKLIDQLQEEKKSIQCQYIGLKDKYLRKLKQVSTIQRYFCGFVNLVGYRKCKYVYDFLYGEMFSRAKIFLLSLFMKRRVKKIKKTAKTLKVTINGIKHFVQLFQIITFKGQLLIYKKKQPGFYIKIYPLQHPQTPISQIPISDEKKISKQTLQKLIDIPLCYEFNYCNGKLMSWDEYLSKKSFLTIHYVKKFIQRLTKRYKNRDNRSVYHVVEVVVKFGGYVSVQTRVFVNVVSYCREEGKQIEKNDNSVHIQPYQTRQQASNLTIFTIGGQRYWNNRYNISINQQLCLQSLQSIVDISNLVTNLVRNELISNFSQHSKQIIKLQKFIKLCNCRRKINKMKMKNKISVFVNGNDVITFCKYSMGKSFIIAENIVTKDREIVETIMDLQSFQHISLIKDKLSKERTCKDKLKLTCKYIWTKFFISKLRTQYKTTTILTEFQVDFRNRVIFSKMFNNYIYKKKPIRGRIVFSLVVESLLQFPRPYILRVFTINRQSAAIDIKKRIYNRQKLFYEKNIENLSKLVNLSSKTQMQIINQAQQNEIKTNRKRNSRTSRRSSKKQNFLMNKIPNASSEDEIKSTIQQQQVPPRVISKKASMLIRFRQRRSNQLRSEQNMFERSSRTPSTYSLKNKEEVDI